MLRRLRRAQSDSIGGNWATVAGGNLVRLSLGFVSSVLIARTLGATDFGVFAILGAVGNIVGSVADFGLNDAAVKRIASLWPSDCQAARARAAVFVSLRLGVTALVVLFGGLATVLVPSVLGQRADGGDLLRLALLGVGATAISGTVTALLQATKQFRNLTIVGLTNAGLTAVLAVALVAIGRLNLVTALVVLGMGTSLAAAVVGVRLLPVAIRPGLPDWTALRAEGRELFRFARWLSVSNLFAMTAAQLDLLLLSHWYAPSAVGSYALALNLATKVDLVNSSMYTVLLPAASSLTDPGAVGRYVRRCLGRSGLISLAVLPLLVLIGPIVAIFYGAEFRSATTLFRWLMVGVIFDIFAIPLILLTYHFNRLRLLAAADILRVGVLATSGVVLIPPLGPGGAVAAKLAGKLVGTAVVLIRLARPGRLGPSDAAPEQRIGPS